METLYKLKTKSATGLDGKVVHLHDNIITALLYYLHTPHAAFMQVTSPKTTKPHVTAKLIYSISTGLIGKN